LFAKHGITLFNETYLVDANTLLVAAYFIIVEYNIKQGTYKILLPYNSNESYSNIIRNKDGRIFVTSMSTGLWVIDNGLVKHLAHQENYINAPATNTITSLLIDRSMNLWLGCDSFPVFKPILLSAFTKKTIQYGLAPTRVVCIF
jgi:ligand-binding sensor domain-containing protein